MTKKELIEDIRDGVKYLSGLVTQRNDLISILREENKELREQVSNLMDRFMSRDFAELQTLKDREIDLPDFKDNNLFSDEEIAGGVIEDINGE